MTALRIGLAIAILAFATNTAPRPAHSTASPVDVSGAGASSGQTGAPEAVEARRVPATPAPSSRASGAPTTRPSLGPTAAVTPRPTARPTHAPRATTRPRPSKAVARPANLIYAGSILDSAASWYCLPHRSACTAGFSPSGLYAAAGPAIRAALGPGWMGQRVTVCTPDCGHPRASVVVRLIDFCQCPGGRLLDLYAGVYAQLGPLSTGLLDVEVEVAR